MRFAEDLVKAARTLAALVATTAAFASAGAAHAVSVVVNGTTYDVTSFNGSYSNNISRFTTTEMPWFDNASLAQQFATAVETQLGTPNFNTNGPYFAYAESFNEELGVFTLSYLYDTSADPPVFSRNIPGTLGITYAVASAQGPSAVPGPLPLFGAAAAFDISRRLRRRIKLSA